MRKPLAIAATGLLLLSISIAQAIDYCASAKDISAPSDDHTQSLQNLFESEFAILRIEGHKAHVAGMAFVIRQAPLQLLTCYHVVSQGTETNNGEVIYAIARRTGATNEIDVRRVTWSWLRIKSMLFKPEYDLAILTIDPDVDPPVADKLDLKDSKPLALSFESQRRAIGSTVTWLTTAAQGDLTLTPRLFAGNIVANYITDETYSYRSNGDTNKQVIVGARMLEVDKLFIPGSSGSPILNADTKQVIGYVHGYRAFALESNVTRTEEVEIGSDAELAKEKLKYKPPLVTSVSLGIDLRTAQRYFAQAGYVEK